MDDEQTTLADYSDDVDADAAGPTPAENARQIMNLADAVGNLVEQVETIVDETSQQRTEPTGEQPRTTTTERMFQ